MEEITRLYFTNGKPVSFADTAKFIESLTILHNLKDVRIIPFVDREIDFEKLDLENPRETPHKEILAISILGTRV